MAVVSRLLSMLKPVMTMLSLESDVGDFHRGIIEYMRVQAKI